MKFDKIYRDMGTDDLSGFWELIYNVAHQSTYNSVTLKHEKDYPNGDALVTLNFDLAPMENAYEKNVA